MMRVNSLLNGVSSLLQLGKKARHGEEELEKKRREGGKRRMRESERVENVVLFVSISSGVSSLRDFF